MPAPVTADADFSLDIVGTALDPVWVQDINVIQIWNGKVQWEVNHKVEAEFFPNFTWNLKISKENFMPAGSTSFTIVGHGSSSKEKDDLGSVLCLTASFML